MVRKAMKWGVLAGWLLVCLAMTLTAYGAVKTTYLESTYGDGFEGTIVLVRPEPTQMTANIVSRQPATVYLEWQPAGGALQRSAVTPCSQNQPAVIVMTGLKAGSSNTYRMFFKGEGETAFKSTAQYSFETPKSVGAGFTFVVQSDSHLANKADPAMYKTNMQAMSVYQPDFLMDMGDTFLNDQDGDPRNPSVEILRHTYLQQRGYLDIVTRNAPLFQTIGNHEGEYGYYLEGSTDNLALLASQMRKLYYPNPVPDSYYSGNRNAEPLIGLPENYYAYTWGDALFVVIDPYRYSSASPESTKDGWAWSLGKDQYDWFRTTLEGSGAKYKFVFAHHAIGNVRGGAEVATLYEWGGYDKNGEYLFDVKRPGWGKPIQQVMKDSGVTIFFQGHDHLFARENVDGVVYQTLPKPAETLADQQSNFGAYPNGDVLMNSGFLKVQVSPENVQVDYHRNYYVSSESQSGKTGIVYSYAISSSRQVQVLKTTTDNLFSYGGTPKSIDTPAKPSVTEGNPVKDGAKAKGIRILINGKAVSADGAPFIDSNGRTQVPVRIVGEGLGCQVLWEENGLQDSITLRKTGTEILLRLGSGTALVNGKSLPMDSPPQIRDGKTNIPVRAVSEMLGATVQWNAKNNTVSITSGKSPSQSIPVPTQTTALPPLFQGVILGYPTAHSVTLKAIASRDQSIVVEYGTAAGPMTGKTDIKTVTKGSPVEIILTGLIADTAYTYQLSAKGIGEQNFTPLDSGTFHTVRAQGSEFVFTLQADSHRDENSDIALYQQTLKNISADRPDFHFDLGDTFMGEKLARDEKGVETRYAEDRVFFETIGASVPLFLVNGNHEGENGWNTTESADHVAVWASQARLLNFPNRPGDAFYTGSANGKGNYYAFTWGDAQFIALDPFWFSEEKARSNEEGWNYTLGKTQYDWLARTLSQSEAKYKFIFIHNLVGGYGKDARGGAEASEFFEWGGKNADGTEGFNAFRPGWGKPIHQILVENGVTAVFHGHDHFYAKQERDGIVYQLVPQPSHPGSTANQAEEYSYKSGVFLPPAGHLRVSVNSAGATVEYVYASTSGSKNGTIEDTYRVGPN